MKGSTGTSMQCIEYRPRKKGVPCKNCKHLKSRAGDPPYYCEAEANKQKAGRYYTSIVKCSKYDKKEKTEEKGQTIRRHKTRDGSRSKKKRTSPV